MSMSPTLQDWLRHQHLKFDTIEHPATRTSLGAALVSGIPGNRMAKAVVLRDGGDYMLAVLPASSRIELAELSRQFERPLHLATEPEVERLFDDCAPGAVPAAGECYGVEVVVDARIEDQPDVYFEGGDHRTLVHMDHDEFAAMMADAQHRSFSSPSGSDPWWIG